MLVVETWLLLVLLRPLFLIKHLVEVSYYLIAIKITVIRFYFKLHFGVPLVGSLKLGRHPHSSLIWLRVLQGVGWVP